MLPPSHLLPRLVYHDAFPVAPRKESAHGDMHGLKVEDSAVPYAAPIAVEKVFKRGGGLAESDRNKEMAVYEKVHISRVKLSLTLRSWTRSSSSLAIPC